MLSHRPNSMSRRWLMDFATTERSRNGTRGTPVERRTRHPCTGGEPRGDRGTGDTAPQRRRPRLPVRLLSRNGRYSRGGWRGCCHPAFSLRATYARAHSGALRPVRHQRDSCALSSVRDARRARCLQWLRTPGALEGPHGAPSNRGLPRGAALQPIRLPRRPQDDGARHRVPGRRTAPGRHHQGSYPAGRALTLSSRSNDRPSQGGRCFIFKKRAYLKELLDYISQKWYN